MDPVKEQMFKTLSGLQAAAQSVPCSAEPVKPEETKREPQNAQLPLIGEEVPAITKEKVFDLLKIKSRCLGILTKWKVNAKMRGQTEAYDDCVLIIKFIESLT